MRFLFNLWTFMDVSDVHIYQTFIFIRFFSNLWKFNFHNYHNFHNYLSITITFHFLRIPTTTPQFLLKEAVVFYC